MELRLLQRLVRLMQRGEITDLEVDDTQAGLRIRLKRGPETPSPSAPVVHVTQGAAAPLPVAAAQAPAAVEAAPAPAASPTAGGTPFVSPMVGTFYRSSSPDSEPFVSVGSSVKPESVLCIIEAMKVMNEIKAEVAGQIVEVLAENGEPVEFGQPLFLIKTG